MAPCSAASGSVNLSGASVAFADATHVVVPRRVGLAVNPELLRRLARQCRILMLRVRTDAARRQLWILADELEQRAKELELECPRSSC
jgi:hypothetical protein